MEKEQSKQRAIKFWISSAKDNFDIAEDMLHTGRYSFCMFMCQQAVEALLKAIHIIKTGERPIYIHKLPRLLDLTGLKIPNSVDAKILKIDAHYIKARYKEERFNPKIYNKQNASNLVKDTKDVIAWFSKNLKLKI